jgi:tRNA pseudouridine55 synthase
MFTNKINENYFSINKKIPQEKVFVLWKPIGITSNKFIQKIKLKNNYKKIGHGGTLDPLAKGLLLVGIDEGTKKLSEYKNLPKEYIAVIKLGEVSTTDDREGKKTKINFKKIPKNLDIDKILKLFSEIKEQIPPTYSAVKVNGKEAYKLARKSKKFSLKPKNIIIYEIKMLKYKWPFLKIKVKTGPGVYIRALARDIGKKLKTGGYLWNLTRTKIGNFSKKDCLNL